MQMPRSVKIGAYDILIDDYPEHHSGKEESYGEFSADKLKIYLDLSVDKTRLVDVLMHEINHGIYWFYQIDKMLEDEENREENIVMAISRAWTQIYKDNPELLQFIQYKLGG